MKPMYKFNWRKGVVRMDLKDTVDGMLSDDYQQRFVAEMNQLQIRKEKLIEFLINYEDIDPEPACPRRLLEEQLKLMGRLYLTMYERARCEGIDIG